MQISLKPCFNMLELVPGEKPLGARERTNNKLNQCMASTPGFSPEPHVTGWEASALNTSPSLFTEQGE